MELVEALQIAMSKRKPISTLVDGMKTATLPGLIEYGCMRLAFPNQFPRVPASISRSNIGMALSDVRSEVGLRQDGPQRKPANTLQPKPVEFYVLESKGEVETTEWNNYCDRFERGAKRAGFIGQTAINLQCAMHEMASNAVIHSEAGIPPLVGYEVNTGIAMFTVADLGIGVLASLRSSVKYQHLQTSVEGIQQAMRPGVSRFNAGGFGFSDLFKAVASDWGELRFRSGDGCVGMYGSGLDHDCDEVKFTYPPSLLGFQVSMCCRLAAPNSPGITAF